MAYRRDYLSAEEYNDMMLIGSLIDVTEKMRKTWPERNMLGKEQVKNLKYSQTYLMKVWEGVISTLNPKELKKMLNRSENVRIKILDKHTIERFMKDCERDMETCFVPTDQFFKWCEEIIYINCRGCKKSCTECELYDVLHDNRVPEFGQDHPNCRYAYTLREKKEGA